MERAGRRACCVLAIGLVAASALRADPNDSAAPREPQSSVIARENVLEKDVSMEDFETGFHLLQASDAQAYDAARARWQGTLAASRHELERRAVSADWRTAINAAIVLGRIDHGPAYDRFQAALAAEDIRAAGRMAGGLHTVWAKYQAIATRDLQGAVLPLCWEVLLKHVNSWPDWQVTAYLRILWVTPDPRSLEPLMWFLETTANDGHAHDAARAVALLGRAAVATRLAESRAKHELARARLDDVEAELTDIGR